jgi:hypothetical protein
MYNLENITPQIIEQELIPDGVGTNFRPIKKRYVGTDFVVDEVFTYKHPANHPAWLSVSKVELIEPDLTEVETFREWDISNHPVQTNITRKVALIKLEIDKQKITSAFIVKHNGAIEDKVITRIGDNSNQFDVGGTMMGEREYWDYLTNQGYTPYQLLDQRVPQMDNLGIFNLVY